ncbi:MAG: hypothetical protein AABW46_02770 [Nanoarchaeota archaeon]
MDKQGKLELEYVVVLIILAALLVFALFFTYRSFTKEGGFFNNMVKNTLGEDFAPSLRGTSEEIKNDPKGYVVKKFGINQEEFNRYLKICEEGKDPKENGGLNAEEIAIIKEKACDSETKNKVREAVSATIVKKEDEADELYKTYRDNNKDLNSYNKLKDIYPSSMAFKAASILESNDFEKAIKELNCDGVSDIITLTYCADIYKTKAIRIDDRTLKDKYGSLASEYFGKVVNGESVNFKNNREKWFFLFAAEEALSRGFVKKLFILPIINPRGGESVEIKGDNYEVVDRIFKTVFLPYNGEPILSLQFKIRLINSDILEPFVCDYNTREESPGVYILSSKEVSKECRTISGTIITPIADVNQDPKSIQLRISYVQQI